MPVETKRPERAELFIKITQLLSLRSTCGRLQVGCIITKDNRIISSGYNGPLATEEHCHAFVCETDTPCTRAIHAEQNAITFAHKMGIKLVDTTIYCTHSPCKECAKLIIGVGINTVVYAEKFRSDEGLVLLKNAGVIIEKYEEH